MKVLTLSTILVLFGFANAFAATEIYEFDLPSVYGGMGVSPGGKCYYSTLSGGPHRIILLTNASGPWTTEYIYNDTGWITNQSICFDSQGYPIVLINSFEQTENIRIARYNGATWNIENTGIVGTYGSIVYSPSGKIYIVYKKFGDIGDPDQLCWMYKSGSIWKTEILDPVKNCSDPSLAIDKNGTLHLAYTSYQYTTARLRYGTKGTGAWNIQTLLSRENEGWTWPVIASDYNGHPWIAYADNGDPNNTIFCHYYDGSTWHQETVLVDRSAIAKSIVTDKSNRPIIGFSKSFNNSYVVRRENDGAWSSPVVVEEKINPTDKRNNPRLAIDSNDILWVCYYWYSESSGEKLHIARIDDYVSLSARSWNLWE